MKTNLLWSGATKRFFSEPFQSGKGNADLWFSNTARSPSNQKVLHVQGSGFPVQGSRFMVPGSRFRVLFLALHTTLRLWTLSVRFYGYRPSSFRRFRGSMDRDHFARNIIRRKRVISRRIGGSLAGGNPEESFRAPFYVSFLMPRGWCFDYAQHKLT